MTTIPDHLIDKALAAGVRARAERAVALDRTESLDRSLVAAALSAVADDLRAEAFDQGAEYGWQQTCEGFNGEYAKDTTHDGAIPLVVAMGDYYTNPYKETDR